MCMISPRGLSLLTVMRSAKHKFAFHLFLEIFSLMRVQSLVSGLFKDSRSKYWATWMMCCADVILPPRLLNGNYVKYFDSLGSRQIGHGFPMTGPSSERVFLLNLTSDSAPSENGISLFEKNRV
jgi:hypothetical protein